MQLVRLHTCSALLPRSCIFLASAFCIYFALGKLSRIVHVSCICASCVHERCSFCSLRMLEAYAAHVLRTLRMSCALCLFAVQLFRFFVAHVFGICRFVLPIASVRCASVVRVLYVCCMFVVHMLCILYATTVYLVRPCCAFVAPHCAHTLCMLCSCCAFVVAYCLHTCNVLFCGFVVCALLCVSVLLIIFQASNPEE